MQRLCLGFDVYGTLVDPLEMSHHLRQLVGERAEAFSAQWREKQVEYAFRRGLMEHYADFATCTRQALEFTMQAQQCPLSAAQQELLLHSYQHLSAFPDVIPALGQLRHQGHQLVAFSNGPEQAVRTLLANAGVLEHLDGVVSVDDLRTFKPNPRVYHYLAERRATTPGACWLISGNPWDVIGAKGAGLRAAWIRRDPARVFDPWEFQPDLTLTSLEALSKSLPAG